ncbi:hypothetical protein CEE34_06010 [Candidatus Aerophobetes bacterium Ae_b3a]|nr:MAG: hypothetical protein CEE34_06010 [Candidatus Aerophobetes bacterium Ae_b3a]
MHERIDKTGERVKRLERIVKDNDIGTGLTINTKQNGNGLKRLALESIKGIGGKEAIEGLKRVINNPNVNRELKTYASNLFEVLIGNKER